jgi:hypothetical protein
MKTKLVLALATLSYPKFRSLKDKYLCFQHGHARVFTTLGPFPASWGDVDSGVATVSPGARSVD